MFQARAQQRSIPGAVATVGVNERVAFLRRTYAHLGLAILAFVARRRGCDFGGQLPNRRQVVDYVLSFAILMATSLLLLAPLWQFFGL